VRLFKVNTANTANTANITRLWRAWRDQIHDNDFTIALNGLY